MDAKERQVAWAGAQMGLQEEKRGDLGKVDGGL